MDRCKSACIALAVALGAGCSGGAESAPQDAEAAAVQETQSRDANALDGSPAAEATPGQPAPIERSASLDDAGRLTIEAGDLKFALEAPVCRSFSSDISICSEDVALSVSGDDRAPQVLHPETLHVNSKATLFRGSLDLRDRTRSQSIVVSDVNADDHDDLALWTGTKGGYGGASYDIYLFEPAQGAFSHSESFSSLTEGATSLFTLVDGKISRQLKSGCCIHAEETFAVEDDQPVLVERVVEDASSGADPPVRTVSRRIDGEMREVQD